MNTFDDDPVLRCCRDVFGIPYPFPWQRLIICAVLDALLDDDSGERADPGDGMSGNTELEVERSPLRQIALLPTGAGKSLCWMLPAVLNTGLTVAVFPLLSLMTDQKRRLSECGIESVTLKGSQSQKERGSIWRSLESGAARIVLANPEILQSETVEKRLRKLSPNFLVVDETHTVSQWGESFRPACAGLGPLVESWNPQAVLALTATAGPYLRTRIVELLFNGVEPNQALADPDRPMVHYGVLPTLSRNHTLERLVREEARPAIVFGPTRSAVEGAARLLRRRLEDERIRFYHAGLEPEEKAMLEQWFMESSHGILCATCAYGMGIDKRNIRTVIHLAPPSSVEAYLQESGRASRDGLGANAWLIYTPEDVLNSDDLQGATSKDKGADSSAQVASEGDSGGAAGPVGTMDSPTPPFGTPGQASLPDAKSISRARRTAMIRYAASSNSCRREMLLEELGIESEDCSGCDVCGREAWIEPPGKEIILKVVRWNRGRFRKRQLVRILIGWRTAEIRRTGLDLMRGFGALTGWELEDVEEAISVLIRAGTLKYRRFGPRGRLSVTSTP